MWNRRKRREERELQEEEQAWLEQMRSLPDPRTVFEAFRSTPTAPPVPTAPVVDDFLPPDLRMPSRDELTGMLMPWNKPLVIGGEVRTCPQCGAYRDWIIISMGEDVWLRCRAGHETLEARLDTVWFNRNSGPLTVWHPTLEDGLESFGH